MLFQDYTKPDLSKPLEPQSAVLENAVVIPEPIGNRGRPSINAGVLDQNGNFVHPSITWRGHGIVTHPPTPAAPVKALKGRYLYLGPLFGHFGHFLMESLGRLWALDHFGGNFDGVIFVPKVNNGETEVKSFHAAALAICGLHLPVHIVTEPTEVEHLVVPPQGFGLNDMVHPSAEMSAFAKAHMGGDIAPKGAERIYLSRSALPRDFGTLIMELSLEAMLEEEGYTIYHPQKHSFEEQVAQYRAAKKVISMDGSPLHMLAFFGIADADIAIIPRRSGDLVEMFTAQFDAFTGARVHNIDCLIGNWNSPGTHRIDRIALGEMSFARASEQLAAAGFIRPDLRWPDFDRAGIEEIASGYGKSKFFLTAGTPLPDADGTDPLSEASMATGAARFGLRDFTPAAHRALGRKTDTIRKALVMRSKDDIALDAMWQRYLPDAEVTGTEGPQDGGFDLIVDARNAQTGAALSAFMRLFPKLPAHGLYLFDGVDAAYDPARGGSDTLSEPNLIGFLAGQIGDVLAGKSQIGSMHRFHGGILLGRSGQEDPNGAPFVGFDEALAHMRVGDQQSFAIPADADMTEIGMHFLTIDHADIRVFHPEARPPLTAGQIPHMVLSKGQMVLWKGDNTYPSLLQRDPSHPRVVAAADRFLEYADADGGEAALLGYADFAGKSWRPMHVVWALNRVSDLPQKSPAFYTIAAQLALTNGSDDVRRAVLTEGLEAHPDNGQIAYEASVLERSKYRDFEKAAHYIDRAVKAAPENETWRRVQVQTYISAKRFAEALTQIEALRKDASQDPRLAELEAIARENLKDNPGALTAFEGFTGARDAKFHRAYARQLLRQKRHDEARAEIDLAIEMDPTNAEFQKWRDTQFGDA